MARTALFIYYSYLANYVFPADVFSQLHLLEFYCIFGKTLTTYSLAFVHLIPSWLVWAEIECTVHVALPKWPISKLTIVPQSRQQVLRAYCPIYNHTVLYSLQSTNPGTKWYFRVG